ncbi:MAG TPA: substrate-binding domain-containing protein [Steroidobacteraceae bacterium]
MSWFRYSVLCAVISWGIPSVGAAGEQIIVVGSSTMFPFSTIVGDHFAKSGPFKTPDVRSSSTSEGIKLFCSGRGGESPDIATASRRMTASERAACAAAGVRRISEIRIGYDSLILASIAGHTGVDVTPDQFWRAVAKFVPVDGAFVPNPYLKWRDIAPTLPDQPIELFGPAPGHGTRDALVSLVMEPSCSASAAASKLSAAERERRCSAVREDGRWTNVENLELILGKLASNPHAMGVMTYSYLEEFPNRIGAAAINGVSPTRVSISSGTYTFSRPLFIYVNGEHLLTTSGLADYAAEYVSLCAAGATGYLLDEGLVPLPMPELLQQRKIAARLQR